MASAKNTENGELLEAEAHIWNHTFKFINSMSLKSAIELGIPDVIHRHGKPMTLSELINELPVNKAKAPFVYRLMRILIHSGFFTSTVKTAENDEAYLLTPACKLLLKDEPMSVSPYVLLVLDPMMINPWHKLSEWFRNDDDDHPTTPFATTHGAEFWDLAARNPNFSSSFNDAMARDACLVSQVLIEDFKHVFYGINSMVDVGGGTGTMAKAFGNAFPHLKCIVLDLPHVVDGLERYENIDFVAGDMFQYIPPVDAVLLKWIMHNWADEECVNILKKCKEAIPSKEKGGKVIIIDIVLEKQENGNAKTTETKLFFDTEMMMVKTGKERAAEEWALLFFKAGFTDYKINPILGLRSLIEVFY